MELSKITIKNFRSIKDEIIDFDKNCIILVGKNEAGKSNVLKAIAAVFGEYTVTDKDKRKRIDTEKIEEYFTRATIKLSKEDHDQIALRFHKKFKNSHLVSFNSKKSLKSFIELFFNELLIHIKIENSAEPIYLRWLYKTSDYFFIQPLFLNGNEILPVSNGHEKFNLEIQMFLIAQELYEENPIRCNYWQYNDNFLLPNKVNIEEFIAEPSSVKGLENIFILCKRENIQKEFEDTLSQDGDYSNLLEQVSKSVSVTFQKIWRDFRDTSIQLTADGGDILIKVVNKTKYSFEDRSDGFKKFISILLMLSTQSRANKIQEKDLILIDEPDQSLYPTSARYLRDELLTISKNSKVIYSTHSQYMLDSDCIDRHLIVEKKDDVTAIRKEDKNASFSNDELLRQATGSSIFECLQSVNIIFEGWLDKELFNKYCEFEKSSKEFNKYGIVYLNGISGVETLVQLLILAQKKFVIVSDSDQASNSKRDTFKKSYAEFNDCWLSYADITKPVSTMEDYFEVAYLKKALTDYNNYAYDEKVNAIENISAAAKKDKEVTQAIKNKLMQNVKKENIKVDYGSFVNAIKSKISEVEKK